MNVRRVSCIGQIDRRIIFNKVKVTRHTRIPCGIFTRKSPATCRYNTRCVRAWYCPNITGQTNSFYRHLTSETSSSGALYAWNQNELKYPSGEDGGARKSWLKIDASASSSIYGDFSTVQPKAAYTLIIIKV